MAVKSWLVFMATQQNGKEAKRPVFVLAQHLTECTHPRAPGQGAKLAEYIKGVFCVPSSNPHDTLLGELARHT